MYVEFERHGAGGSSISSHYFDLLVKLKNEQEHLFRNIQRNEYHNLFDFIRLVSMVIFSLPPWDLFYDACYFGLLGSWVIGLWPITHIPELYSICTVTLCSE